MSAADRVLVALTLDWTVAVDAQQALREMGAQTTVVERASVHDVADFGPTVLLGAVTGALRLAQQDDLVDSSVRLVVLTAEPGASVDGIRRGVEDHWGAACLDVYALSEVGVIGWGCSGRRDGIHLEERELKFEVLDPDEDRCLGDGELGELAVTTPPDWASPLAHFRTGDLVRLRRDGCACGRGSAWLESGVLGRVDDRLTVRGHVILPVLIEQVVRRHPAVVDYGLRAYTVRGQCEVAVEIETTHVIGSEGDRARVAAEVAEDLKRSLGLRLQCDVVPPGNLSSAHTPGRRARRLRRQG